MRVDELVNLKSKNVYLELNHAIISGKGSKVREVVLG